MDVIARNGRDALIQTAQQVMRFGAEVSPRGMRTRELRHLSVLISNPYDVLCTGINANQSLEVVAAEAIQVIGGFSDPDFAIAHVPALARFTNDKGRFDGAYGPRIARTLPEIVERLREDRDTRQAIVPIWGWRDAIRRRSRDYPCTLNIGFFIRDDLLEMDVFMRSNDVALGAKNDWFVFTQLQLSVARLLHVEAGPYRHTASSVHIYEQNWGWAEDLDDTEMTLPIADHPTGIGGDSVYDMFWNARAIARNERRDLAAGSSEWWYREHLHG